MRTLLAVAATAVLLPTPGAAQVLDFDAIGDWVAIGDYYSRSGESTAGITFFGNALAVLSATSDDEGSCPGSLGFPRGPSGCGALFYYQSQVGSDAGINVAGGFTGAVSLHYYPQYRTSYDASFTLYSGVNGGGTALATVALPKPAEWWMPAAWERAGATFADTARSIVFTNAGGSLVFDDVAFGVQRPTDHGPPHVAPEPASFALLGTGLAAAGAAGAARRRRR